MRSIEEKDTRGAPEIKVEAEVVLPAFSTVTIHERAGIHEKKRKEKSIEEERSGEG